MSIFKKFVGALIAVTLVACGGGGGSSGGSAGTGSTGGTGTGTGTTTPGTPSISVALQDSAGNVVSSIGFSGYKAVAVVKDATGAVVAGRAVTFSLSSTNATLTSATALSGSDGVASVGISSAAGSTQGAATLTAAATVAGTSLTATQDFAFSGAAYSLSAITGSTTLTSGGNTPLSVTASIGTSLAGSIPVPVTYTANCGSINGIFGSVTVNTDGSSIASANYSTFKLDGSSCSGAVVINAATTGGVIATPLSIAVSAPVASSVNYVSATLNNISVQGSGAPTDSILTFKVLDANGAASTNTPVTFTLPTAPPGVVLTAPTPSATDNTGLVTVKVSAGTIPGALKVRAAITSTITVGLPTGVYSESQNLTVASGPPAQERLSVSVSAFNIEGQNMDGSGTTITARLADRQGNAVQDGTIVNFTTSGGQVASSCATAKINGISQCSVVWQSQNPRPSNGRVAVLAYAVGNKTYTDNNLNNTFDAGDTLFDIGNPYRDDNENGAYNPGVDGFVVPLGGSGTCTGTGEPAPGVANTCNGSLATFVRSQVILLNASSVPEKLLLGGNLDMTNSPSEFSFTLRSRDNRLLPMPVGTTVTATSITDPSACKVNSVALTSIGNVGPGIVTNGVYPDLATLDTVSLSGCSSGQKIQIKVTAPSGSTYVEIVQL